MREKYLHCSDKEEKKEKINKNADTKIKQRIANILDDYIRDNQINDKDFAKKAHIAASTFNGYKNGDTEPKLKQLKRIADAMNVSTDYLLGKSMFKSPDNIDILIHKELGLSELAISNLRTINNGVNEWLLDTINFLLENEMYNEDEYLLEQDLEELDCDERYSEMPEEEKNKRRFNIEKKLKEIGIKTQKVNPQYIISKLDEFFTTEIKNPETIYVTKEKVIKESEMDNGLEKSYMDIIGRKISVENKLVDNVLLDEVKLCLMKSKDKYLNQKKSGDN